MSRLTDWLRAVDPRARAQHAHRLATLIESNRALGRRLRGLEDAVAGLARLASTVHAEHEQLAALRREDEASAAHLAALEPGIEADAVTTHVRAAVSGAAVADHPCPHLVVHDLLPRYLYDALVNALPARALMEEREPGTRQVPAPPRLASVATIVLWNFVIEAVVRPVLVPALTARFGLSADSTLAACQLVRREPGCEWRAVAEDDHIRIRGVLFLVRPGDGADFGTNLSSSTSSEARVQRIPFTANTLVAVAAASGWRGTAIPSDAPPDTARYALQFQLH